MNLLGSEALYRSTWGSRIAFARPCAMWNFTPIACAMAWLMPRNALENARPASVEASAMPLRASRSLPSRYAFGSQSKIIEMAWVQNALVYDEEKIDTAPSSAWVSASSPVSAVEVDGSDTISVGSTIALSGSRQ